MTEPNEVEDLKSQLEYTKNEYAALLNRFMAGADIMVDLYRRNNNLMQILNEIQSQQQRKLALVPPADPAPSGGCAV